jgi:PadR family transcriptional regulator PadR
MNTQFRKGAIEMCILALISCQERYGYELVQAIGQYTEINEGTVYPILRRLTQEEYVSTYLVESPHGPARKYYRITAKGEKHLEALKGEWISLSQIVNSILGGEHHDKE